MQDKDKCAHLWQPGGDERATFEIRDCPRMLHRDRQQRFMPGVLASTAARLVESFLKLIK